MRGTSSQDDARTILCLCAKSLKFWHDLCQYRRYLWYLAWTTKMQSFLVGAIAIEASY